MKQQASLIETYDKEPSSKQEQEIIKPVVPIKITGSKEDKNNLAKLVNRLAKSEHGKKVLEKACEAGIGLAAVKLNGFSGFYQHKGFYGKKKSMVIVNPSYDEKHQLTVLAHELRHSEQCNSRDLSFLHDIKIDVKSQVIGRRAMEADAMAYHHLCVWELDKAGEKGLWEYAKKDYPEIAKGTEQAVKTNGTINSTEAMKYAFKGWYKNTFLRNFYEKDIINHYEQRVKNDKKLYGNSDCFADTCSCNEVISRGCEIDGKAYINPESKLLEKRQYLGVKKSTFDAFDKFFKDREKETGIPADKSLKEIPLTYPKKKEIPIALLKAKLKRR